MTQLTTQPLPQLPHLLTARDKAVEALLKQQHQQGWWKADLESNASIEAEDMLLRHFLGIADTDPETIAATARWLRHRQRDDGTWAAFYGGPGDVSITIEAYAALRLAGDPPDAAHMTAAADFICDQGGIEASRVFTRIWLALFGEWSWDELPTMLPEMILLPKWAPLNIYDFGCWARQTIVPLTLIMAYRPVRPLPFSLAHLRTGNRPAEREPRPASTWAGRLQRLDRFAHHLDRRLLTTKLASPLRQHAMRRSERWILERQEADGSWGGIQPPWVYSMIALSLRGYALDHPVMAQALEGLRSFEVRRNDMRWLECCQSPVWDTALAVVALGDAEVPPDDDAMVAAAEWLLAEEVRVKGDWSVRRPQLEPGGWAFEFENDNYPDVDDTAEVALALTKVKLPDAAGQARLDAALRRAINWLEGMQCSDGGYAAFDVDNTSKIAGELPFCDFGEVIDPPSADVTAHAIEMLCHLDRYFGSEDGQPAINHPALDRAVTWLLNEQEPDGAWFGRWGSNYLYGTGAAVPALIAAGIAPDHRAITAAVDFLHATQRPDGGWGEDIRSYTDPTYRANGESTASQTAWALLALIAAGDLREPTLRGAAWLIETQRPDGTWDEPWYTGTGFPGDFLINYHLYRDVFPITALSRLITALRRAN